MTALLLATTCALLATLAYLATKLDAPHSDAQDRTTQEHLL